MYRHLEGFLTHAFDANGWNITSIQIVQKKTEGLPQVTGVIMRQKIGPN